MVIIYYNLPIVISFSWEILLQKKISIYNNIMLKFIHFQFNNYKTKGFK